MPNLSLPKAVVSTVDKVIGAGGVIEDSPDNITLYNSALQFRLLLGPLPHDELLGNSPLYYDLYSKPDPYWKLLFKTFDVSLL